MGLSIQKTEQKEFKKIYQKSRFSGLSLCSTNKGFTLMETLVAIAILLIAVVGPIGLIGDAVHKLYYAKDQMIAINLAQEGIEAVRQVRDNNKLTPVAWNTGLIVGNYTVDVGKILSGQPVLTACAGCQPQPVFYDTTNKIYRQGAGSQATVFKRRVIISNPEGSTIHRRVVSEVTWNTGGQAGSVSVMEYIFNLNL